MAKSSVLREFATYAQGRPGIDPDVVDTAVAFKAEYLGDRDPTRWHVEDLVDLLLELFPRKVLADPEWFAAAVPTLQLYVSFLRDRRLLHRKSDPVEDLLATLDDAHDEAVAASRDPSSLQAVMDAFNALPIERRKAMADPGLPAVPPTPGLPPTPAVPPIPGLPPLPLPGFPGLPGFDGLDGAVGRTFSWGAADDELTFRVDDVDEDDEVGDGSDGGLGEDRPSMPVLLLPPRAELAAAVRGAPLVVRLRRFVEWLGPDRPLTQQGRLRMADAREVCALLGLSVPDQPKPRHARAIPELEGLWWVALEGGFVTVLEGRARPGIVALLLDDSDADTDDLVGAWSGLLERCLEEGLDVVLDPEVAELDAIDVGLVDDVLTTVDESVLTLLGQLYSGAVMPLAGLEPLSLEIVAATCPVPRHRTTLIPAQRDRVAVIRWRGQISQLLDLGAVTTDADGQLTMTPLGRVGFRLLLVDSGVDAPLLEDAGTLDAASLLRTLGRVTDVLGIPLVSAWMAARPPEVATADLIDVARNSSAGDRFAAVSLLTEHLGGYVHGPGRVQIEPLRDDPVLWAYTDVLLDGAGARATPAQRQWMTLDAVAATLDAQDSDDAPDVGLDDDLDDELWDSVTGFADLETAWRCEHPQLLDVLEAIANRHPSGRIRKAAKKSLFKARQRLSAERTGRG